MSAYLVGSEHIDLLVSATFALPYPPYFEATKGVLVRTDVAATPTDHGAVGPDQLGQALWEENMASLLYRYPQDKVADYPDYVAGYRWRKVPARLYDWVTVVKAIQCYHYQSCEHPGWRTSPSCLFTYELLTRTVTQYAPGIQDAPAWEWSRKRAASILTSPT